MDPNEALEVLREWVNPRTFPARYTEDEASEAFAALDNWITNGGFLPADWSK